jgi:hypothetical protein
MNRLEPDATLNPSQPVDVPFVKLSEVANCVVAVAFVDVRLVVARVTMEPFVLTRFVTVPVVAPKVAANKFVDVALVNVPLVEVCAARVERLVELAGEAV